MKLAYQLLAVALVAGCGSSSKTPAGGGAGAQAAVPGQTGEGPADPGWQAWRQWVPLAEEPVASEGHGAVLVLVRVAPAYAEDLLHAVEAGDGRPMTPGTALVQAHYVKGEGGDLRERELYVMAKLAPGYAPERGDWYYGVFDPDASRVLREGLLEDCIACHQAAPGDHLFLP